MNMILILPFSFLLATSFVKKYIPTPSPIAPITPRTMPAIYPPVRLGLMPSKYSSGVSPYLGSAFVEVECAANPNLLVLKSCVE